MFQSKQIHITAYQKEKSHVLSATKLITNSEKKYTRNIKNIRNLSLENFAPRTFY